MADKTKIEWTDATWTPIRARRDELLSDGSTKVRIGWHCEHVSEGCRRCYAESLNRRLGTGRDFKPVHLVHTTRTGDKSGDVEMFLDEKMLLQPLRWSKGRNIFVCSMTDLFADFVPFEIIDKVFAVMAMAGQHTFQCLTKRSARMRLYMARFFAGYGPIEKQIIALGGNPMQALENWPLKHVWLGVSVEDQSTAAERIADLLMTTAAIRYLSMEPLLGPVDLTNIPVGGGHGHHEFDPIITGNALKRGSSSDPHVHWVICGGESGHGARPMHPDWARALRDQCAAAGVPFLFKQWGEWGDPDSIERTGIAAEHVFELHRDDGGALRHEWPGPVVNGVELRSKRPEVLRVGKKAAGRLLDGIEHNGMPEINP